MLLAVLGLAPATAPAQIALELAPGPATFSVFLRSSPVGFQRTDVRRSETGWIIESRGDLSQPLDIRNQVFRVDYDFWLRPEALRVAGVRRSLPFSLVTTFAAGAAWPSWTRTVSARPSISRRPPTPSFSSTSSSGGYEALAWQLGGSVPGAEIPVYVAPRTLTRARVDRVGRQHIETRTAAVIEARVHGISFLHDDGVVEVEVWTDPRRRLLRVYIPQAALDLVRDDIAGVGTRVRTLAHAGTRRSTSGRRASGSPRPSPRPSIARGRGTAGRPSCSSRGPAPPIATAPSRGCRCSGSWPWAWPTRGSWWRATTGAASGAAAGDRSRPGSRSTARTPAGWCVTWTTGTTWTGTASPWSGTRRAAGPPMLAAARERRADNLVLIGAPSTSGAELVLEQQGAALDRLNAAAEERNERIGLQRRIIDAVRDEGSWDGVPDAMRRQADTYWFRSFLDFDVADALRRTRQPLLILHGSRDTHVGAHHAQRLAELAGRRGRGAPRRSRRLSRAWTTASSRPSPTRPRRSPR